MDEIAKRSKHKYLLAKQRGDDRLALIPQYLKYVSRFDGDLTFDHVIDYEKNLKLGQVHIQRQNYLKNDHKLNQIACTQMKLVLKYGHFKMSKSKLLKLQKSWKD